eukprot:scaffold19917_cov122-Isochrysis_galbana.AAC.3
MDSRPTRRVSGEPLATPRPGACTPPRLAPGEAPEAGAAPLDRESDLSPPRPLAGKDVSAPPLPAGLPGAVVAQARRAAQAEPEEPVDTGGGPRSVPEARREAVAVGAAAGRAAAVCFPAGAAFPSAAVASVVPSILPAVRLPAPWAWIALSPPVFARSEGRLPAP